MPLKVFTERNFAADFIRLNLNFIHKNDKFAFFEPPFGGVRGNVRTSSIARFGKRVVDFLFAIIEHFSIGLTVDTLYADFGPSRSFSMGWVTLSANFRWKGHRPPTSFGVRKLE